MSTPKPIRCQKCKKLLGYLTPSTKSLLGTTQSVPDVEMVCPDCHKPKSKFTVP